MDRLSVAQRAALMSRIRGRNTTTELVVRKLLRAQGYRYRLHRRDLPGCPDLVLSRRRIVLFVHGCFWHRHSCRRGRSTPTANAAFWQTKLLANRARDKRARRRLRAAGWTVFVIWECQTRNLAALSVRLRKCLSEARVGQ